MEMNGNIVGKSGSNSSNEDLSQYTDADESMSAPTEILAEFLSALMVKDYPSALKFCKIILQYEPNHETAKQFYPLIQEKLLLHQANEKHELDDQIDECSSEDDASSNSDENGNVLDDGSDIASTGSSQRDSEETTASYSSLEDEVVEPNTVTENVNIDNAIECQTNTSNLTDDNGNTIQSVSTTTSDSDSHPESKKVSAKLKSLLSYRKNNRYSTHAPI